MSFAKFFKRDTDEAPITLFSAQDSERIISDAPVKDCGDFLNYFQTRKIEFQSEGVSPIGFVKYLSKLTKLNPALFKSTSAIVNWDTRESMRHISPAFMRPDMHNKVVEHLDKTRGHSSLIVYDQSHTYALMKDDRNILFADSYYSPNFDASMANSVLRLLRDQFPKHEISVFGNSMQSDSCNCALFSTHNIREMERFMQGKEIALGEFIETLDTQIVGWRASPEKGKEYIYNMCDRLGINIVPIPACLVPHVQPYELVRGGVDGSIVEFSKDYTRKHDFLRGGTYEDKYHAFLKAIPVLANGVLEKKLRCCYINVQNRLFKDEINAKLIAQPNVEP